MKLLLIEDNPAMQTTLRRAFERQGIHFSLCADGNHALAKWKSVRPDVVVLDLSLPGIDGLEVLAQARAEGLLAPVLILTARGTVGDRVLGLNTGADDYMAKPFDLEELEARVRALARRASASVEVGTGAASNALASAARDLHFGQLRLDAESQAIYAGAAPLELSTREAALLRALLYRPGQAVAKERLSQAVFAGDGEVQADAIEVVAYRLRKRLAGTGTELVTLRGLGYLLRAQS